MLNKDRLEQLFVRFQARTYQSLAAVSDDILSYVDANVTPTNPAYLRFQEDRQTKWKTWGPTNANRHRWTMPSGTDLRISLAYDLFRTFAGDENKARAWATNLFPTRYGGSAGEFLDAFSPYFLDALNAILAADSPKCDSRTRDQKFGILDAPKMLTADLRTAPGIFGRAILYFDLDNFKALNTRFTERVVDSLILPPVHELLRECVRHVGFAYAEGGDEFTVHLPNASEALSQRFAADMLAAMRAIKFAGDAADLALSASFGVAHAPADAADHAELPGRANVAKNFAKQSGKNCVALWTPEGCSRIAF